ncbi:hypothetical protein ABT381_26350 [Streptomyces sp. NPDC000151]|uniref:hypothetical protein n=1 Tax=Streptomyces sp. NPDC000151 TaxID=3154244 RepID=UPI00332E7760
MSTTRNTPRGNGRSVRRWSVLALTVVVGAVESVLMAMRGNVAMAVTLPVIVIGYGLAVTVLARRSDVAAQLSGHEEDERRRAISRGASAVTGNVLAVVLLCGAVYEVAQGESGGPFTWLCAVGGLTYGAAAVAYTRKGVPAGS